MCMTLQEFDTYINVLLEQQQREQEFSKAMENVLDGTFISKFTDKLMSSYVQLLEHYFHDEDETIGWWMWEWDCGKKEVDGVVGWFIHNVPVPMKNTNDLFNYLIWNKCIATPFPETKWDGTWNYQTYFNKENL